MFPPTDTTVHRPKQSSLCSTTMGLAREWETYRQEVSGLLAQGLEGQFVLIKGDQLIGLFSTWEAARTAGLRLFLLQPFLIRPISRRDAQLQRKHKYLSRRRVRSYETIPGCRAAG